MLVDITINLIIGTILTVGGFLINKYYLSKKPTLPPGIIINNSSTSITNTDISLGNTYVHNYHHNHYNNIYRPAYTSSKQKVNTTSSEMLGFFILGAMIFLSLTVFYAKYSNYILSVCIWISFFFVFLNFSMLAYAFKNNILDLKELKLKKLIIILLAFWLLVFITSIISIHSLFVPIEIIEVLRQMDPLQFSETFSLLSSMNFSIPLYIAFLVFGLSLLLLLLIFLILYQILSLIAWRTWLPLSSVKIPWTSLNITELVIALSFFYLMATLNISGILANLLVKI